MTLGPPENADKKTWRAWAKQVRAELDTARLSREVTRQILAWEGFQQAQKVLVYVAFGSEIDLTVVMERGLEQGKEVFTTRTWMEPERKLTVHPLSAGLEPHPFGYLQPPADAPVVSPESVDLVLVPGLCFDTQGTRLGYGMGFYDRLLQHVPAKVPRIGVTVDTLIVENLPSTSSDIPMTHLASESGVQAAF